jgi:hypothetical protein
MYQAIHNPSFPAPGFLPLANARLRLSARLLRP